MLIINADDWGRSTSDTDAILLCHTQERISSVSAMVFMTDSQRAANLAKENSINVGLHLNFTEQFTGRGASPAISRYQNRTHRFLCANKYAVLFYNPLLREEFRYLYQAQVEEFIRLYGYLPSHVDGHQHMHLCANMMIDRVIPVGERVRRSFSFWPEEKSTLNRFYRRFIDSLLARRYRLTDFFFALSQILRTECQQRISDLATRANLEVMAHPRDPREYDYLMSEDWIQVLRKVELGNYSMLPAFVRNDL